MTHRVLVVDDADDIREIARVSLRQVAGYDVSIAASGREALERAKEDAPDAILLDVMMPGMDGPAVIDALRAGGLGHVPVVLLTASIQPQERDNFDALGVAGIITKPFDPMQLGAELGNILGWST